MFHHRRLWLVICLIKLLHRTIAEIRIDPTAPEPYAPYHVQCNIDALVRPATSLSANESLYTSNRKALADHALLSWLEKAWGSNTSIPTCNFPTLALAMSGGGPKAGLLAAGVMQGLDSRDSSYPVSGLLQSMTYISALSGGSLTLAGTMGNNFAKISVLRRNLYDTVYPNLLARPLENNATIRRDIAAKTAAGYPTSLVDVYGRLIGFDFIGGIRGASGLTWSSVASQSEFTSHRAPYPIITQTNADVTDGQCIPNRTGSIWEFSPFEFGSWQSGVQAFVPTRYLGTTLGAGTVHSYATCTEGFDNLGFFTGISADILIDAISSTKCTVATSSNSSTEPLAEEFLALGSPSLENVAYGVVPNPFLDYAPSTAVSNQPALYLLDGGLSGQGIPMFPFLQPQRKVDVVFVADDESLTAENTTDGSALYATYTAARKNGLSRMPLVPENRTYSSEGLVSRASFFGCHNTNAITIIYMPDTTATNTTANDFAFGPSDIDSLIQAGTRMVTQSNDTQWPVCVACAVMHKSVTDLPSACTACLEKYCWTRQGDV